MNRVTPYTGVWVEIITGDFVVFVQWSRPTRACELKCARNDKCCIGKCHALHGRVSWNCHVPYLLMRNRSKVTPYTGVWVEIPPLVQMVEIGEVTPYTGVWVEILKSLWMVRLRWSRPTRACELKWQTEVWYPNWPASRPTRACELKSSRCFGNAYPVGHALHGRVSWNYGNTYHTEFVEVTPYTGVWVEMEIQYLPVAPISVTPYTGVWVEINVFLPTIPSTAVTPYTGVWVEICTITM